MRGLVPDLPVIIVTNGVSIKKATGTITKFLRKPIQKEELIRTVRALIGGSRERESNNTISS